MVILDTCAIIEVCKQHVNLSGNTLDKINKSACILSISFAEIACKVKLGKLTLNIPTQELHALFVQMAHIEIIDITTEIWFNSVDLDWDENKDPVDRLIMAFAIKKDLPIVTSDGKMSQFYKKVIW